MDMNEIIATGKQAKRNAKALALATRNALKAIEAGNEEECLKQLEEASKLSLSLLNLADKLYDELV
jgi:hypothetical protein|tara:strand:- start:122 stop:319 length:198 start_codon:yes stop_codon:yes gene_type:complete